MNGNRSFLITRYVDVLGVLRDDKQFSSDINQRTMGIVMGPTVIGMDGKEHLKHRTLITPSMTPRALKGDNFHEVVQKTADDTIDAFVRKGMADLHHDFCFKFPLAVFVSLLGLPSDDLDQVHRWGIDLCLVAHDPGRGLIASEKLLNYLTPIVEAKRSKPDSDMISMLVTAQINGAKLSDYEVVSFLRLLVLAGAETTNHLLGTVCYVLLQNPELMERVRNDRTLIPALLHEGMRWESPIGTLIREATSDTEIGNHSLAIRCRCAMTPTPAGTNSSDRWRSRPPDVSRRFSLAPPRSMRDTNSSAMPTTGPGTGRCRTMTAISPASW